MRPSEVVLNNIVITCKRATSCKSLKIVFHFSQISGLLQRCLFLLKKSQLEVRRKRPLDYEDHDDGDDDYDDDDGDGDSWSWPNSIWL